MRRHAGCYENKAACACQARRLQCVGALFLLFYSPGACPFVVCLNMVVSLCWPFEWPLGQTVSVLLSSCCHKTVYK